MLEYTFPYLAVFYTSNVSPMSRAHTPFYLLLQLNVPIKKAGDQAGFFSSVDTQLFKFFCQQRDDLKQISDDAVVGNFENVSFRIFVNGDDDFAV